MKFNSLRAKKKPEKTKTILQQNKQNKKPMVVC